jgi:outer membrane protein assembly factor BamA
VSKVNVAPDNQYRFGGALSFRGYREDELQAQRFAWTELESRYRLDAETYAFLFAGAASTSTRYSLFNGGIGFSYDTRLGPLRFTYAGSSDRGILQGVVHFSLSSGL